MMRKLLPVLLVLVYLSTVMTAAPVNRMAVSPDPAAFGGSITVTHDITRNADFARLECFQNGVIVLRYYTLHVQSPITMGPLGPTPSWVAGGADCVVSLGVFRHDKFKASASVEFAALP